MAGWPQEILAPENHNPRPGADIPRLRKPACLVRGSVDGKVRARLRP